MTIHDDNTYSKTIDASELVVTVDGPHETMAIGDRPTCCYYEDNTKCINPGSPACVCCFRSRKACLLGCLLPSLFFLGLLCFFLFPRCVLVSPKQETFQLTSLSFGSSIFSPALSLAVTLCSLYQRAPIRPLAQRAPIRPLAQRAPIRPLAQRAPIRPLAQLDLQSFFQASMDVTVTNSNYLALTADYVDIDLYYKDAYIGKGELLDGLTIPSRGSHTFNVNVVHAGGVSDTLKV